MAYKIVASQCTVCGACEFECPNAAIRLKNDMYIIDPKKCTECEGAHADPQCATICPIEGAILDSLGEALNPPGSLTGIPPERMAQAMAELQAH